MISIIKYEANIVDKKGKYNMFKSYFENEGKINLFSKYNKFYGGEKRVNV